MPDLKILGDSPTTEDGLGFDSYVDILSDAIHNFDATGSLTIGIHGSWGSGKTSLMCMLEKRVKGDMAVKTVWFNAWAQGQKESIGLALLHRVLTELSKEEGPKEEIRTVLANIGRLLVDAGLRRSTGITLKEAQEFFKNSIEIRSTLRDNFKAALAEGLSDKRLVVFVDDLDRCLPEKTIEILEVIKLFLDVPRCIFVIGVAKEMIEQGFAVRYKTRGKSPIRGRDYIEKIIQVPFTLPPIRGEVIMKFIESLSMNEPERKVAKLVAKVTHCNPRKVKVFLNICRIRQEIAEKTEGLIDPEIATKFFNIEYTFPDFYKDLVRYREQDILCTLERLEKGDTDDELRKELGGSKILQRYYENEDFRSLLRDEPFFCGVNLEPYIYLSGTKPTDEVVLDELLDDDSVKWKHAANKIKKMPDADKLLYVNVLVSKLKAGTESERVRAALGLGRVGATQAVEPLIHVLESKDEDLSVRLFVAKALGEIGDSRAIKPLIETLKDEKAGGVRWAAAEALGKIGDAQAIDSLIEALQDEDEYVREYAAGALGEIGDSKAVEPLIDALTDVNPEVRGVVAYVLGVIGDPRAVKPLRELLEGEWEGVKEIVLESIKKIETKQTTLAENKQND